MTIPPKPDTTGTQYSIPAPSFTVATTNTIGDVNVTDQLPKDDNGLEDYPTAIKTWETSLENPAVSHTVFTRDIITTELPGADGTGAGAEAWTNARADITYTNENYGKEK